MSEDSGARSGSGGAPPSGLFHSLRNLAPSLIALVRTRLELFGIELSEERARAVETALLAALTLLFAALTFLMLNVLVLAYFWESHRYLAIGVLAAVYGSAALVCGVRMQSALAARPPMFEATMAELKSDLEALNRVRQD